MIFMALDGFSNANDLSTLSKIKTIYELDNT